MSDDILREMDEGMVTSVVFLDFTKAFDAVNHHILIRKLQNYGVSTYSASQWFESYLSGRYQVTTAQNELSKPAHIPIGVAQGSVLVSYFFSST